VSGATARRAGRERRTAQGKAHEWRMLPCCIAHHEACFVWVCWSCVCARFVSDWTGLPWMGWAWMASCISGLSTAWGMDWPLLACFVCLSFCVLFLSGGAAGAGGGGGLSIRSGHSSEQGARPTMEVRDDTNPGEEEGRGEGPGTSAAPVRACAVHYSRRRAVVA
jgi:hypothetical protein